MQAFQQVQTNHLSLKVNEKKVELTGLAGLTSKTRSLFASYTNMLLEMLTYTTSETEAR